MHPCACNAGPVGKELLKAAASEGLEAFLGGTEHAANKEAAEKAARDEESREAVSKLFAPRGNAPPGSSPSICHLLRYSHADLPR